MVTRRPPANAAISATQPEAHGQASTRSGWDRAVRREGQLLAARTRAWRVAVETDHPSALVALAAHGGLGGRWPGGTGSSPAESRTAGTAYGFRTPSAFAAANLASPCGVQPSSRAASTAGVSRARWSAVSRQAGPSALKNSPARQPPPAGPSAACSSSVAKWEPG